MRIVFASFLALFCIAASSAYAFIPYSAPALIESSENGPCTPGTAKCSMMSNCVVQGASCVACPQGYTYIYGACYSCPLGTIVESPTQCE